METYRALSIDIGSGVLPEQTMKSGDLLLLRGNEIVDLFSGRELEIVDTVRAAYLAHEVGDVSIPNCPFLRFPGGGSDRIIPKPAMLGGEFQVAGIKWIASFPGNLSRGLERASATLLLNSVETGLLEAILESSVISAYRTAASAALAANLIRGELPAIRAGVIGCGLINFETLRFLLSVRPEIQRVLLFDASPERMRQYRDRCARYCGGRELQFSESSAEVLENADIVSLATTAVIPHIASLAKCRADAVILHISLRDLEPEAILMADNTVDDVDHVCSNRTSLDLTEQQAGNRDFIRTTIGAILSGTQQPRAGGKVAVFSPFGLGILDLALGHFACRLARRTQAGLAIPDFLPTAWTAR